jgi:hypothetical protein
VVRADKVFTIMTSRRVSGAGRYCDTLIAQPIEDGPLTVMVHVVARFTTISLSDGVFDDVSQTMPSVAVGEAATCNLPAPRQFTAIQADPGATLTCQDFAESPLAEAVTRLRSPGSRSGTLTEAGADRLGRAVPDDDGDPVAPAAVGAGDPGRLLLSHPAARTATAAQKRTANVFCAH